MWFRLRHSCRGAVRGSVCREVSLGVRFLAVHPVRFLKSAEVVWNVDVALLWKIGVCKGLVWSELRRVDVRKGLAGVRIMKECSTD